MDDKSLGINPQTENDSCENTENRSAWDEAIANGAVSLEVFSDMLTDQIKQCYSNHPKREARSMLDKETLT